MCQRERNYTLCYWVSSGSGTGRVEDVEFIILVPLRFPLLFCCLLGHNLSDCLHAQSYLSFLTLASFSSSVPSLIPVLSKAYTVFLFFFIPPGF